MQLDLKSKNKIAPSGQGRNRTSFLISQLVLLQSRRRWGIMYTLATISGLFVPMGGFFASTEGQGVSWMRIAVDCGALFVATFLIITGMYVLNDLVDADLDRSSGKKRPIPSGQVSKAQARIFVIMTSATGIILAVTTFNPSNVIITFIIIGIGLMYSAPKISVKDRFVMKTVAIAATSMLCLMLGGSYAFNSSDTIPHHYNYMIALNSSTLVCTYAALMSGSIIFITSLLNDLGDVDGDMAFGRRTIPIVIGKKNTVILTIVIAVTMAFISWITFYSLPDIIGLINPILISLVTSIVAIKMAKILKHLNDDNFIRQEHKKSMRWHVMLQSALIVGGLLFCV
jgi:geranylgeranylglycerol-phosphate geranylgeranyltransferase